MEQLYYTPFPYKKIFRKYFPKSFLFISKIYWYIILSNFLENGGITMENNVRPDSMERITNEALANAFIEEQVAQIREKI